MDRPLAGRVGVPQMLTVQIALLAAGLTVAQLQPLWTQFTAIALFAANTSLLAVITLASHGFPRIRLSAAAILLVGGVGLFWTWSALMTWPHMYRRFLSDPRSSLAIAGAVGFSLLGALVLRWIFRAGKAASRRDCRGEAVILVLPLLMLPVLWQTGFAPLYATVFLSAYALFHEPRIVRSFYAALAFFATLFAIGALAQYVAAGGRQWITYLDTESTRLGGGEWLRYPIELALFFTVSAICTTSLFGREASRSRRWLLAASLTVQCIAVLLTWTRAAWAAVGLVGLIVARRRRAWLWAFLGAVSLLIVVSVVRDRPLWFVLQVDHRREWLGGWQVFLSHPILGVGVGGWALLNRYNELYTSHNIVLQFLSEVGLIGTALVGAVVVFIVQRLYVAMRQGSAEYREVAFPALLALAALTVFALTNASTIFPCAAIIVLVLLAAVLGPARALTEDDAKEGPSACTGTQDARRRIPKAVVFLGTAALLVYLSASIVQDLRLRAESPEVPRVVDPPRLDGSIGADEWQNALTITRFVDWETGGPVIPATTCYVTYDEASLYIAFICEEDDPRVLDRLTEPMRADIWDHDSVEVHIDPGNRDRDEYAFFLSPAGDRWQTHIGFKYGDYAHGDCGTVVRQPWHYPWRGITLVGERGWVAEMAIPFREMGVPELNPGARVGILVARNRPEAVSGDNVQVSVWPLAHGAMNLASEFQDVRLAGMPRAVMGAAQ